MSPGRPNFQLHLSCCTSCHVGNILSFSSSALHYTHRSVNFVLICTIFDLELRVRCICFSLYYRTAKCRLVFGTLITVYFEQEERFVNC